MLASAQLSASSYAQTTWSIQTVDYGHNTGWSSSLALDSSGYPCISYLNTSDELLYAGWNGSAWNIQKVDSKSSQNPSLALDSNNNPCIGYRDRLNSVLKYARQVGSEWNIQVIDHVGTEGVSLDLDSNGYPYLSYNNMSGGDMWNPPEGYLKIARWNGSAWSTQIVDSWGNWHPSLALDSNDVPCITYCSLEGGFLKYAKQAGSGWAYQTVDSNLEPNGHPSLVLDSNDNPCICYCDSNSGIVKYASWNGSAWNTQVVNWEDAGWQRSLAIDSNDKPCISYFDQKTLVLKYAKWEGSAWNIQAVDSGLGLAGGNSLALDSDGNPRISYTYNEIGGAWNSALRFAFLGGVVPEFPSIPVLFLSVMLISAFALVLRKRARAVSVCDIRDIRVDTSMRE